MSTSSLNAEMIAVGSELLMGEVINSNAAWVSKKLAALGIDVHHHVTVGDNPERIKTVVTQAFERSNVLIFTGGLGPTADDLTVATLADYFGATLVSDPDSEAVIRQYFITRDTPMSPSNIKQALRPEAATVVKNPLGTAPGIAWDVSEKIGKPAYLLCFPGVPRELYAMWDQADDYLLAKQKSLGITTTQIHSEFLHFFGIGESKLAEALKDLMEQANPSVAPYVGRAEVRIRVAAKTKTKEEADGLLTPLKAEIINRCRKYFVGSGDTSLEKIVGELLTEKSLALSVAESCTGGLISHRITDISGSALYTHLNVVTYSNTQKHKLLGVSLNTLENHGAVSAETAREMALGILNLSGCDLGLSATGIAGPTGGTEEKPIGLVYIGLTDRAGKSYTLRIQANPRYSRSDIKYWFSQYALNLVRLYLLNALDPDTPGLEIYETPSSVSKSIPGTAYRYSPDPPYG